GAERFGLPSAVRGTPGVGYLSHWASADATAVKKARTVQHVICTGAVRSRRDLPACEVGKKLQRSFLVRPVETCPRSCPRIRRDRLCSWQTGWCRDVLFNCRALGLRPGARRDGRNPICSELSSGPYSQFASDRVSCAAWQHTAAGQAAANRLLLE